MSYQLEAFIGNVQILYLLQSEYPMAKVVSLKGELGLVPLSDELFDTIQEKDGSPDKNPFDIFWKYSDAIGNLMRRLSINGQIAYVEAEFWAGVGEQSAVVWYKGQVLAGPWKEKNAINSALRELGVDKQNHFDEFEAVKLGRYRDTGDWLEET